MRVTNKFNLPEPVVLALSEDDYSRGDAQSSVTTLIDAPRARMLRSFHDSEITSDASEMVWLVLGRATHKIFENHAPARYTAEQRLFTDIDGWTISGAIDIQHESDEGVTLYDYKTTSVWSVIYGKPEWEKQLNAYAWMVRQTKGVKVIGLAVVAILRDWQIHGKERGGDDYPEAPIVTVEIPLWPAEEADRYMRERVKLHQEAQWHHLTGDRLPLCSDEERWKKPDTWAVRKKRNKRALRVYESQEEAEAHAAKDDELVVDHRPGELKRCKDYCKAAPWCDQYQEELAALQD